MLKTIVKRHRNKDNTPLIYTIEDVDYIAFFPSFFRKVISRPAELNPMLGTFGLKSKRKEGYLSCRIFLCHKTKDSAVF